MIDYQSLNIKTTKAHRTSGSQAKKERKERRRIKKPSVLSSFQTKLMKESQHQAPLCAFFAFAVKFSWRYVITL
jgi:hypothetical protein